MNENFQTIETFRLHKALWNYKTDDPALLEKLKTNIAANGFIQNILVRKLNEEYFEVLNGNHRLEAIWHLGITQVTAYNFGTITQAQAERIAIETNETTFKPDHLKLAGLLRDIQQTKPIEDLEASMPFDIEQLRRYNEMLDFHWQVAPKESTNKSETRTKPLKHEIVKLTLVVPGALHHKWAAFKGTKSDRDAFKHLLLILDA